MYFIQKGELFLIHKGSRSYIKELGSNTYVGEVAFFSDKKRSVTCKAKTVIESLKLDKDEFLEACEQHEHSKFLYERIVTNIRTTDNLSEIRVYCYVCNRLGHLSIECPQFDEIKGNIRDSAFMKFRRDIKRQKSLRKNRTLLKTQQTNLIEELKNQGTFSLKTMRTDRENLPVN